MDAVTDEIKRRADIAEVIGQYVALRPAGGDRFKACCPFHDEKTPSFNVSRDKGFYKCFGCLDEDELIWTERGLRRIGAAEIGERVLDQYGQWQPIIAREDKRAATLEISTGAFRHDALRLTPDHLCLCVREADARAALPYLYSSSERGTRFKSSYRRYLARAIRLTETPAADLQIGDFFLFPVVPETARNVAPLRDEAAIAPYVIGKRVKRIAELPVNEEAAFLYGLYLAEGSTNLRSVRWTFHLDEKHLAEFVWLTLREQFDLPASQFLYPKKNIREIICSKTDLARQMKRWFGKGCANKRLPAEALSWPKSIQAALLRGYRCGDGNSRGASVSVSRELSYGLFALAIQCEQAPSLGYMPHYVDSNGLAHRAAWRLWSRCKQGLDGFFQPIGDTQYFWSRIRAIEPAHESTVVDITVAQSHSFTTKLAVVHNCGKAGDVFKFLQEIENISFPEAKRQLAERYGVALPRAGKELSPEQQAAYDERDRLMKITAAATAFFREQFAGNKGLAARDYARTRGLSPHTLDKFGIGYAPDSWDALHHHLSNKYGFKSGEAAAAGLLVEKEAEENRPARVYDRYRHRLIFPIWDAQGRVIAFGGRALEGGNTGTPDAKYINSPEGVLFSKSRTLYAWHLARAEIGKRESVIVTEGYMDAIALHEAGFANTIATLGTALTTPHVAALARLSPKIVYLCYDGDSAGMRAALRAAPLFATHELNVRVVTLPGGEDPDTFIKKFGPVAFERALHNAPMLARHLLEQSVAAFDLGEVASRMEAVRAAAEVIADVESDIEKDASIAWLAERWGAAEGVTAPSRLQMIAAAIRREVGSAVGRRRQAQPIINQAFAKRAAEREEESNAVSATLAQGGSEIQSGVTKAERMLLSSLLGNPSWRSRILGQLPPSRWTQETHREIAAALRQVDFNEPVDAGVLMDTLSADAGGLVGELMMSEESQIAASDEIINDCVARVEDHWARQIERETLEMLQLKIARAEPISEAERQAYNAALLATRRKTAPPEEKSTPE